MPVPPIPDDRQDGTTIRAAHVNQIAAGVNDLQQQINDLPPGGYSAYELWIQQPGNEGKSLADFFEALRSDEPGPPGPPGPVPAAAGLLAERPAPGTLPEGYSYFAVDDLGGTTSTVVGGVWVRRTVAADATTVEGHGNYVSGSVQETLERMDDAHGVTARLDHRMQVIEWDAMIHTAPTQTWEHQDFITPAGLVVLLLPDTTIPSVVETHGRNELRLEVSEHSYGGTFVIGAVGVTSKARHHTSSTVDLRCRMRIPTGGSSNPTEVRFGGAGASFRMTTAFPATSKFDVYALPRRPGLGGQPSDALIGQIDHFSTHDFRLVGVDGFWQWWLNNELIHSETSTADAGFSGAYVSLNKTADATETSPREVAIFRLIGAWTV